MRACAARCEAPCEARRAQSAAAGLWQRFQRAVLRAPPSSSCASKKQTGAWLDLALPSSRGHVALRLQPAPSDSRWLAQQRRRPSSGSEAAARSAGMPDPLSAQQRRRGGMVRHGVWFWRIRRRRSRTVRH
jgi:hypothetical protein